MNRSTSHFVLLGLVGFGGTALATPNGDLPLGPQTIPTLRQSLLGSRTLPKPAKRTDLTPPVKVAPDGFQLLRADAPAAKGGASDEEKQEAARAASEQKAHSFARLRQILKGEPTVKEVQRSALKLYKLEPERLKRMGTAARAKGLVPDIEVSVDNSVNNQFTNERNGLQPQASLAGIDPNNPNGYSLRSTQNSDGLTWHVRGTWYLNLLVFNSEELDVRSLNSLEENLVREVTTMYYSRDRLIAGLLLQPPDEDEEIFYELLRLDELTATLDAMTGGMFGSKAWKWENDLKQ